MKKHLSKRLLSLFLAVVLLAASAPFAAFAYSIGTPDENTKYLFAYFTSNSQYGQQIRFAVSEDGLNYSPLNYNRPIIEHGEGIFGEAETAANTQYASSSSTSAGYARDPYIFKGENGDGYFLVATDMDASAGGMHGSWSGDTNLVFWHSDDLVNWYQISVLDIAQNAGFESTIRAWAPQAMYDKDKGMYMVYWANFLANWDEAVYYCYTSDFKSFTQPQELYRAESGAAIDADIAYYGGTYYLFYKDESAGTVGYVTSESLTGPYSGFTNCTLSDQAVEGNSIYNIAGTDNWVLMLDEYVNGSFVFQITSDFKTYEMMDKADYSLSGFTPRHGSVVQISNEEYQALLDAYTFSPEVGTIEYLFTDEYTYSNDGWGYIGNGDWVDASGHTLDAFINTNAQSSAYGTTTTPYVSTAGGSLDLYCSQVAINDADVESYLLSENFTVTFDYIKKNNSVVINGSTIYDFSSRPIFSVSDNPTDYIALLNDGTLAVYSGDGNYKTASSSRKPLEGEQISYTITYDSETVILYMDYEETARISTGGGIPNYPTGSAIYAGLGFSDHYGTSPGIYGSYEGLTFYDSAFSATEAKINLPLTLDSLEACVSSFESIVTSGNIYKNTPQAYKYYKEALRLIEVRDYGTQDVTAEIQACAENFKKAIEDLVLWSGEFQSLNRYTSYMGQEQVQGNVLATDGDSLGGKQNQSGWEADSGDIAANIGGETADDGNIYEIRFAYSYRETGWYETWLDDYVWQGVNAAMSVYGDSYIAIYDGKNATSFPIKVRYFSDDNVNDSRGLQSIYLANDNLTVKSQAEDSIYLKALNDNQANQTDFMWPVNYEHQVANKDIGGQGFYDNSSTNIHQYGYISAELKNDAFDGINGNLLVVNPNVVFTDHAGNKFSFGNNGVSSQLAAPVYSYTLGDTDDFSALEITSEEIGAIADGNSATYYVINVEPLCAALESGAEKLKGADLTLLSETDMLAAFEAADAMMKYNPYESLVEYRDAGGNISKDVMQAAAEKTAGEVTELVNAYDEETSYMDNDGYASLNALRTNVEINAMYESNNADNFTTDSWNTFVKAYEASVSKVNELVSSPFENELNEDGTVNTAVTNIVEEVYRAYYGLRQRADFSELETTMADDKVNEKRADEIGGDVTSQQEQKYTIGSWLDFINAYDESRKFLAENADTSNLPLYAGKEETITTNGYTFTIMVENAGDYSDIMDESFALSDKVLKKMAALTAPAGDYDAYDAFTVIYATQDMNAFTDEYLQSGDSIKALADKNGTKSSAQEYVIDSGATAYAEYKGNIYYNANQSELDKILAGMITELNDANNDKTEAKRKSYSVTFELYKNDELADTLKNKEIHYYGDVVDLNAAESEALGDLTCYKWVVESTADNSEKWVVNESNTYSIRIQSDSVIRAYCADNGGEAQAVPVEIRNVYGSTMQTLYLSADTQITLGAKSVEVSGASYDIPDVPFYSFSGWRVNGSGYANGVYTVSQLENGSSKVVIQALYTATNSGNGSYTVTLNNNQVFANRWYDDRVTVTAPEDTYAILVKENGRYSVASYSNTYEFYVNRNMDFYTLTKNESGYYINGVKESEFTDEEHYRLDNKMPFAYSAPAASGDNNDKYTTFSAFSVNCGADIKITEVGTLYTLGGALASEEVMIFGASGISYIKSKDQCDFSNQYSLTFSGAANIDETIYTRAYVKYSYSYTDSKTGETTTVQAIAYGNIVSDAGLY